MTMDSPKKTHDRGISRGKIAPILLACSNPHAPSSPVFSFCLLSTLETHLSATGLRIGALGWAPAAVGLVNVPFVFHHRHHKRHPVCVRVLPACVHSLFLSLSLSFSFARARARTHTHTHTVPPAAGVRPSLTVPRFFPFPFTHSLPLSLSLALSFFPSLSLSLSLSLPP